MGRGQGRSGRNWEEVYIIKTQCTKFSELTVKGLQPTWTLPLRAQAWNRGWELGGKVYQPLSFFQCVYTPTWLWLPSTQALSLVKGLSTELDSTSEGKLLRTGHSLLSHTPFQSCFFQGNHNVERNLCGERYTLLLFLLIFSCACTVPCILHEPQKENLSQWECKHPLK